MTPTPAAPSAVDLLTCDGKELLNAIWRIGEQSPYRAYVTDLTIFRDAIVEQALAQSRARAAAPLTLSDVEVAKANDDALADMGIRFGHDSGTARLVPWSEQEPMIKAQRRAFANRIAALASAAPSAEALTTARREAASKAWDAAANHFIVREVTVSGSTSETICERSDAARDRYLEAEYPIAPPVPRECRLSDGSVVTWEPERRFRRGQPNASGALVADHWLSVVYTTDTGADFDALKQFAATHADRRNG